MIVLQLYFSDAINLYEADELAREIKKYIQEKLEKNKDSYMGYTVKETY